jgi:hypothetical protein
LRVQAVRAEATLREPRAPGEHGDDELGGQPPLYLPEPMFVVHDEPEQREGLPDRRAMLVSQLGAFHDEVRGRATAHADAEHGRIAYRRPGSCPAARISGTIPAGGSSAVFAASMRPSSPSTHASRGTLACSTLSIPRSPPERPVIAPTSLSLRSIIARKLASRRD